MKLRNKTPKTLEELFFPEKLTIRIKRRFRNFIKSLLPRKKMTLEDLFKED